VLPIFISAVEGSKGKYFLFELQLWKPSLIKYFQKLMVVSVGWLCNHSCFAQAVGGPTKASKGSNAYLCKKKLT
jgi:hypothetical protein